MIAIVPIRCESKGIRHKNIKLLNNKPLVWWVLNALQHSGIEKIIVATDSNLYAEIVKSFEFSKVSTYIRTKESAGDLTPTEIVLIETINHFDINDDIMLCQATSPLTTSKDINNSILLFDNYDNILSVVEQKRFFWNLDGISVNYDYRNRPMRQNFDGTSYVENGAIYINSSKNILEHNNRLSGKIGLYIMNAITYFEIDDEHDWKICERIIQNDIISS